MNFVCHKCGYKTNALPREGDLNLCLSCAAIYELRDGVWHMLTDNELAQLPPGIRMELTIITRGIRAVITKDLAFNQRFKEP